MSGLALVCTTLGRPVTRLRPGRVRLYRAARGQPASSRSSATTPPPFPPAPRSSSRPRSRDENAELQRARERGQRIMHRGELLAELCAAQAADRGRRHPRQDDDLGDDRPRAAGDRRRSRLLARRRAARRRPRRGAPPTPAGGRASGSSPRPTRATAASSSSTPRSRSSPTSRSTTTHTGAREAELIEAFARFGPPPRGRRGPARGLDGAARSSASRLPPAGAPGPAADAAGERRARRGRRRFRVVGRDRRARRPLRGPGPPQRRQRAAPPWPRPELAGCRRRGRSPRRWRASRAWPVASSCKGTRSGARIYDDYAHHPTEVRGPLAALRELAAGALIAVFQPHLYSRTKALAPRFGGALAARRRDRGARRLSGSRAAGRPARGVSGLPWPRPPPTRLRAGRSGGSATSTGPGNCSVTVSATATCWSPSGRATCSGSASGWWVATDERRGAGCGDAGRSGGLGSEPSRIGRWISRLGPQTRW